MNLKALTAGLVLAAATSANAANYQIDPTHSFVQFKINHLGFSWLVANFNEVEGTLNFDADKPEASAINMTVATTSLDTNHEIRDGHLSKDTIINNKEFPTASFVSQSYKGDADSGTITGTLSINGVEQTVEVPVSRIGEGQDPWGGYRVGFEGELTFDRRDFASTENFGDASWDVTLEVFVEAIKQ